MWRSVYTPFSLSGLLYLAPRSVPAPHHYTVGGHRWCFQSPFPAFSSFSFLVHSYNLPSYTKRLVPRYIQTRHKTTYKHKHKPASYYKRPTNLFIEKSELVVHLIRVCVCRISQQHAGGAGRSLPQDAERPSNHAAPPLSPPSVPPRQAFDPPQALSLSLSRPLSRTHTTRKQTPHTRGDSTAAVGAG